MRTEDRESIERVVEDYLRREFLPDREDAALTPATPLISGGILSSIQTAKLVSFLEDRFEIRFAAHEIGEDHLDTLADIVERIVDKRSS